MSRTQPDAQHDARRDRNTRREPASAVREGVLAGALLVFVAAEVGFYSLIAPLRETTLTGVFTWQQIAAGNLIGCYLLGARLWRAHPEFRRGFAYALGGTGSWPAP